MVVIIEYSSSSCKLKWHQAYNVRKAIVNPSGVNDLKVTYRVNGGGNLPPIDFSLYLPTDGPILMSDIPKCSEIYVGHDAPSLVAIT